MNHQSLKYFSSVIIFALALCAGWWMWNYYMQSPWTRDGKVRAELVSITPEVSGRLVQIVVHDNQLVSSGNLLFVIDPQPYQLALDNAQAALVKAQADLAKANHEAERRRNLPKNIISGEDLDIANLTADSMKAAYQGALVNVEQAKWNLSKTRIYAPTNGYITNLQTRVGNYATAGIPLVALIDTHSFYVMGYFEETKLKHIREGNEAKIVLYNGNIPLRGVVESIGRAIYDQSVDSSTDLLVDVKPNVPWVRLAQRVPVRIKLLDVPADVTLIAGTTCTISLVD
ncbi:MULTISPECIES: efflux RND transporter periplasmic adaptor subunit [Yersinia]|uniref:Efflux RND transporter periplasmic adaptor subunit n=1 Tax=Yersinia intermedia TaxID=631 RepID=A0ABX6F8Z4_YERIN|nr:MULTISPECIES: HlyD family secretion protein [Yersinia]ARB85012.1 HlyD family secretion protein [Yersinia sp. FDAARGOS_228]AVL34809.1 HlyD family secretion protein [Yersinia intermedia]MCB5296715.1 HlyD family secretion protein [Yersinia intermedia]MCW8110315.1 HlyD family secretion protein [Yersinia intermedia]MDA5479180.1 HlyD family secretion protein [Yersinia intermedia]